MNDRKSILYFCNEVQDILGNVIEKNDLAIPRLFQIWYDKGKFRVKSNDYIFWCKDLTGRK